MFQSKMGLYSIIFGTFLVILVILETARADIPGCHFLETVNLTGSHSFENGSYMYEDIEIPADLTAPYDYITTEWEIYETTETHLRGCVCRLKPCIWVCCRFKDWDPSNGKCTDGLMEELSEISPIVNVTLSNGSGVKMNLLKDFIVLRDPMRKYDFWTEHNYTFFENGSLLLNTNLYNTKYFRGYDCLHPNQFTSDSTESLVATFHIFYYYNPQRQALPKETILFWLSNIFWALTISVYLYVRKLRNLHGKCFICYMIISAMNSSYEVDNVLIGLQFCALQGYFVYYFSIAKFSWLLSLSHQLWRGLSSVNRDESEYSFGAYSIFAWGTPAVLTGVTFLIEQIWDSDPNKVEWVPGMAWEYCYLKAGFMSFNGYLLLPIAIILLLNTILFIWTIISIIRVKLLLRHFQDQHEWKRNLNSRMQKYYLFLRLAIVMDMQWSVYVFSVYADWNLLVEICEYCDSSFGIITFVLFVLKRSTLKLLMERLKTSWKMLGKRSWNFPR